MATMRGKTKAAILGLVGASAILAACQGDVFPTAAAATPFGVANVSRGVGATSMAGSYLAGRFAQNQQDWASASEYMTLALTQRPDDVTLARRAYLLALGAGRAAEAAELGRYLERLEPTHSIANLMLSIEDARAARFSVAVKRLDGIAADGLTARITPALKAWLMVGRGQGRAAFEELQALESEQTFATLYALHAALIAERNGDSDTAAALLEQGLSTSFTHRMVAAAGGLYHRMGQPEKARELYDRYLAAHPGDLRLKAELAALESGRAPAPLAKSPVEGMGEVLVDIAGALQAEGATDMAQLYAQLARQAQPDDAATNLLIGDIFASRNQHEAALDYYDRVPTGRGEWWTARLHAAASLRQLDRTEEAAGVLESLAAAYADRPEPLVELGHLHRNGARWLDAAAAFDRAVARLPADDARFWEVFYYRGVALDRAGQSDRAEADLMQALKLQPDQPFLLNYIGYLWVERGERLDEALEMIERAVALRPNDGYILDSHGWALHRLGNSAAAVAKIERAVELQPLDATINDHLGDVYWAVGRKIEARYQWRRALGQATETALRDALALKLEHGLPASQTAQVKGTAPATTP